MGVVCMVWELVVATPDHYFEISRDFAGSVFGEIWIW